MKFLKKIIGSISWFDILATANYIDTCYTHDAIIVYQFATQCLFVFFRYYSKIYEVNILLLTFGWFALNYLYNYRNFLHSQFPLSGHLRLWHSKNYLLMQYKFEQEWLQKCCPAYICLHNRKIQWDPKDSWKT